MSRYRTFFYTLALLLIFIPFSSYFIDYNFLLRFASLIVISSLWIITNKNEEIHLDEFILLLYYLYNYLACLWSNQLDFAFIETQRTGLYFLSYFIAKRTIEKWGVLNLTRLITITTLVLVIVNFSLYWLIGMKASTTAANPNLLASFLFLTLPFSFYQLFNSNKTWKILGSVAGISGLILIAITHTRSVWLALFLYFSILGYFYLHQKNIKRRRLIYLCIFFTLIIGLYSAYYFSLIDLTSFYERLFIWKKTVLLSLESPWIGIGPGNWIFNYTKYGISDFETFKYYGLLMQRPHNDLLWVWAELGIVGLLILAVFFIRVLKGSLKPPFYTAKNLFICCIFSFIPIVLFSFPKERVEHIFLFFTLIAVASFLSDKQKVVVFKKGARYVFAIILIPSFVLLYYRSVGDFYAKKIPLTINSGDFDKTILYARKSESFFYQHTPIGLPIASYQAYAYSKRSEFDSALFYSRKAYFEAPFNYQVLTNFGAALNAKKQFSLAEKVLLEAHRINNWYDGAIFNLAFVYYNQGDYKKAKIWIDKVSYKSQKTNYFSGLIHKKLNITAE